MLSTIATAALINFLILPITYHDSEPEYIKNKIENYDYYTISQSGSLFYSVTNQIIESAKNLDSNLTFIGRANVGLESVESSNGEKKLSSLENYLYSISIKTIESSKVDFFYDDEAAQVIKDNKLIVSTLTAERYGLSVNDKVSLVGINSAPLVLEVGMIIKDSELSWFEGVVNKEVGFELGIYRNIQAIIWDTKMSENHLIELYKNIEYKRVKITNKHKRNIPNKNWVLPTAMVKEMFGDFQIKERDGT